VQEILDQLDSFADSNATILIQGPTGSGKGVLAKALHTRSARNKGPFIRVDCASIPQTLLESELFGHEKGAYTGAVSASPGRFETAAEGTLFLDEIGNINPVVQAKLLGFLEDHTITRIGGTESIIVNTRVIAATNANLGEMVQKGLFREDLFYRLRVIDVHLPPLRDHRDDIPLLVEHFLKEINTRNNLHVKGVSPEVMEGFMVHDWPGNARELFNVLVNLAVHTREGFIDKKPIFHAMAMQPALKKSFIPENVRLQTIMNFAQDRDYFSARECLRILPVSLPTIKRDLQRLVREKELTMEGKGPAVRYFLKQ
jgi:two-component system response regulator AtoC